MLSSGRPDGAVVRDRLRSVTPRWVPTFADLDGSSNAATDVDDQTPASARSHSLPDEPPPRWRLDATAARGVISLGLAAAVGALAVVVWGWPRGGAVPVAPSGEEAPTVGNVLADPSPSASTAAQLVVDVDGEVRHPGVVELATGSRVVDALKAAGGVTRLGDTGDLNLAEVLIDGQQVVVPSTRDSETGVIPTPPVSGTPGPTPGTSATDTVSLNSATATELEVLPGIGPVLAAAIIDWRTQNGGFTSIEQLEDVSGIGPATFAEIAPLVRL